MPAAMRFSVSRYIQRRMCCRERRQNRRAFFTSSIIYNFDLAPRESASIVFVNSLGGTAADVQKEYDGIINSFDAVAKATTDEWNAQLKAAFTPGNNIFSGLRADARNERRQCKASSITRR